MRIFTLMTLLTMGYSLSYDVNEILKCSYLYENPDRRWCIISKHYEQMWLSCEFPHEEPQISLDV